MDKNYGHGCCKEAQKISSPPPKAMLGKVWDTRGQLAVLNVQLIQHCLWGGGFFGKSPWIYVQDCLYFGKKIEQELWTIFQNFHLFSSKNGLKGIKHTNIPYFFHFVPYNAKTQLQPPTGYRRWYDLFLFQTFIKQINHIINRSRLKFHEKTTFLDSKFNYEQVWVTSYIPNCA